MTCNETRKKIIALESMLEDQQDQLSTAPTPMKSSIVRIIKRINSELKRLRRKHESCQVPSEKNIFEQFDSSLTTECSRKNWQLASYLSYYVYPTNVIAYADFDTMMRFVSEDQVSTEIIVGSHTDTQVYIVSTDSYIFVVFRGTSSIEDWWNNIDWDMVNYRDSKVHKGFNNAVSDVENTLMSRVNEAIANNKKLYITGHSLGGSLASLFSLRLSQDYSIRVNACYTFAAPAFGNLDAFTNYTVEGLQRRTHRWIYGDDIGPHLPMIFQTGIVGPSDPYVQCGREIIIPATSHLLWPDIFGHHEARYYMENFKC